MLFLRCVNCGLYLGFLVGHIFVYNAGGLTGPSILLYNISDLKQIRSRDSQQEIVNMLENTY